MSDAHEPDHRRDSRTQVVPTTRELPCPMSPEEQVEAAQQAGKFQRELLDLEAEFRRLKAEKNAEIQAKSEQFSEALERMHTGSVLREVACEERHDYGAGIVYVVRLDTVEVVDQRPMSAKERQLGLPGC